MRCKGRYNHHLEFDISFHTKGQVPRLVGVFELDGGGVDTSVHSIGASTKAKADGLLRPLPTRPPRPEKLSRTI
jgi:hypothetical protein